MQYRRQKKCKICGNDDDCGQIDAYLWWGRWDHERVSCKFKELQVVSGSYRARAIHTAIAVGADGPQGSKYMAGEDAGWRSAKAGEE